MLVHHGRLDPLGNTLSRSVDVPLRGQAGVPGGAGWLRSEPLDPRPSLLVGKSCARLRATSLLVNASLLTAEADPGRV